VSTSIPKILGKLFRKNWKEEIFYRNISLGANAILQFGRRPIPVCLFLEKSVFSTDFRGKKRLLAVYLRNDFRLRTKTTHRRPNFFRIDQKANHFMYVQLIVTHSSVFRIIQVSLLSWPQNLPLRHYNRHKWQNWNINICRCGLYVPRNSHSMFQRKLKVHY